MVAGCKDKTCGSVLKELMQTTNFRVTVVEESDVVEICGALKVDFLLLLLLLRTNLISSLFKTTRAMADFDLMSVL